jgi:CHAD domain-containing protein
VAKPTPVPGLSPDTPLRVAAPLLLAARLADVRRHEPGVAGRLDPDAVHDMRVAVRRLRAALKLLGGRRLRRLDREVKELQDALGRVRDVQVQLAWLAGLRRELGVAHRRSLRTWAERQLPGLVERLLPRLDAWARDLAPRLAAAAPRAGRRGRLGGRRIRRRLRRRLVRVEELAARAFADPRPAPAHALRIAVKQLRYAAEVAEPGFPDDVGRLLAALAPLQETLGELHDVVVRVERLSELAARGGEAEQRAALRLLAGVQRERGRRERALVAALGGGRALPAAAASGL